MRPRAAGGVTRDAPNWSSKSATSGKSALTPACVTMSRSVLRPASCSSVGSVPTSSAAIPPNRPTAARGMKDTTYVKQIHTLITSSQNGDG
eukprot:6029503-Heterocapsa_arctica.AAC.1